MKAYPENLAKRNFPKQFSEWEKEIIFQFINYSTYPLKQLIGLGYSTIQEAIAGELDIAESDVAKIVNELFEQMEEV